MNYAASLLLNGAWPVVEKSQQSEEASDTKAMRKGVIREINKLKKLNRKKEYWDSPDPPKDEKVGGGDEGLLRGRSQLTANVHRWR